MASSAPASMKIAPETALYLTHDCSFFSRHDPRSAKHSHFHNLQITGNKKGSSRNPGKHRNKNADLMDDVRASKHI